MLHYDAWAGVIVGALYYDSMIKTYQMALEILHRVVFSFMGRRKNR